MKVGDIVRHKAGAFPMVIESINANNQAFCAWLNADGESRNDTFALLSLTPWVEHDDDEGDEDEDEPYALKGPDTTVECMTVGELRKALEGFPNDVFVMVGDHYTCVEVLSAGEGSAPVGKPEDEIEGVVFMLTISEELGEKHRAEERRRAG